MTVQQCSTKPEDIEREDVAEQALKLRLGGKSYRTIGALLGITHTTAHKYVKAHLARRREENGELADDVRDMELQRLDKMLQDMETFKVNFPHKAHEATDRILRIQERRSKYLGLDAPTKIAPTNPDGTEPYEDTTGIKEQLTELLKRRTDGS